MAFYFNGPWSDYTSGNVAGVTATPVRSRISIKEKGRILGHEGNIVAGNGAGVNKIGGLGGTAAVAGSPLTMACWILIDGFVSGNFGTAIGISYEPSSTTATVGDYQYYQLGFVSSSVTPPGSAVMRPMLRGRKSTPPTSNTRTGTLAGVSAWFGPTAGGYLQLNQWIHIVGRVEGTGSSARTLNCFVNGVLVGSGSIASANSPENAAGKTFSRTTIGGIKLISPTSGGAAGAEESFKGYIAEVGIWNTNLSTDQIKSLANGTPSDRVGSRNLMLYAPLIRDLNAVVGDFVLSPESGTTYTSLSVSGNTFISPNYISHPQTGLTQTHPRRFG